MPTVTSADVERMSERLLFEGPSAAVQRSRFWVLLGLAGVIAAAGVAADSVATVIGAMIVAPLMTPILGTAFALVLAERDQMLRSLGLVVGGAALVVAIGFVLGLLGPLDVTAETSSQVASRVSPRLIDLVAALATGLVGAFAIVRADVADTLPGVAIAISLVPPLAVVGLELEAARYGDAGGALLLFGTNVTAIVATATGVLLAYRVRDVAAASGHHVGALRGSTLAVVAALVVVVAMPLAAGSARVVTAELATRSATPVAEDWAASRGWEVTEVAVTDDGVTVSAVGAAAPPPLADLRAGLDEAGLADLDLDVELLAGGTRTLPATRG